MQQVTNSVPEQEDYSDEEEVLDLLVEVGELLLVLVDRPQPVYLQTRLIKVLARVMSMTDVVSGESDWVH
jgi:hypothetical protein